MCKLVSLELLDGRSIEVAEPKYNALKTYLKYLPKFTSLERVLIFGDVLNTRCTESSPLKVCYIYKEYMSFIEEFAEFGFDIYPDAYDDDWVALTHEDFYDEPCFTDEMLELRETGVSLYEA